MNYFSIDTSRKDSSQKLSEKSRECHSHKPQPTHVTKSTKRKEQRTKINACKINKQTNARETHKPALSSPSDVTTMLNRTEKHEDKEQGKIQNETPCSKKPQSHTK